MLANVCLIDYDTEEIMEVFGNRNILGLFDLDFSDDIDYLIEMYLESLSEYDIWEIFREIIQDKEKESISI